MSFKGKGNYIHCKGLVLAQEEAKAAKENQILSYTSHMPDDLMPKLFILSVVNN
jgi:hypothetical protein